MAKPDNLFSLHTVFVTDRPDGHCEILVQLWLRMNMKLMNLEKNVYNLPAGVEAVVVVVASSTSSKAFVVVVVVVNGTVVVVAGAVVVVV